MDGWLLLLVFLVILAILALLWVITFVVFPQVLVTDLPTAPSNLRLTQNLVTWNAVSGASSYDWKVTQNDRVIRQGSVVTSSVNLDLSPGSYVFSVAALNSSGSSPVSSLPITITGANVVPPIVTATSGTTTTATITTAAPVDSLEVDIAGPDGVQTLQAVGSGHNWTVSYPANGTRYTVTARPQLAGSPTSSHTQVFPATQPSVTNIVYDYNCQVANLAISFREPVNQVDVDLERHDEHWRPQENGPISETQWLATFNCLPPGTYRIRIETRPRFAYFTTHTFE